MMPCFSNVNAMSLPFHVPFVTGVNAMSAILSGREGGYAEHQYLALNNTTPSPRKNMAKMANTSEQHGTNMAGVMAYRRDEMATEVSENA